MIVAIPFSIFAIEVTKQGFSLYSSLSETSVSGALFGLGCVSEDSEICLLLNKAERFSSSHLSAFNLDDRLGEIVLMFGEMVMSFVLSIPIIIAETFLVFIIAFFILQDWKSILTKAEDLIPMRTKTKKELIKQFGHITHTVIYAQLFIALVQGIIGSIGFYLAGVPFPIFLGVILAFCALIPAIGTAIVWIPASCFLILSGYISGNYWIMWKGILLFLYGILIISTIDNVLLATIVKSKTKVNQILIIVGVIGGAAMFGIMGIFIGPILLPLLVTYFETFKKRFE